MMAGGVRWWRGSGRPRFVVLVAVWCVGLAVALSSASVARADAPVCVANSGTPPIVRASGVAERAGDLVLTCTGGTPTALGQPIPRVNLTIFTNTNITSRLLAAPWAEPLLLLDEPTSGHQAPCQSPDGACANMGNGTGTGYYAGAGGTNVNVFQGQVTGANSVSWMGVPFDPPPSGGTRVIRLTNTRVNASMLGAPPPGSPPTQVVEFISINGAQQVTISNPQQTVAFLQPGMAFKTLTGDGSATLTSPVPFSACAGAPRSRVATLSYKEGFASAFTKRNVGTTVAAPTALSDQNTPGFFYNTETGFYDHAFVGFSARGDLSMAGLADFGTRLKATFSNVPAGVRVFVDTRSSGSSSAVALRTATESGGYSALGAGSTISKVALVNGRGTAVWEVLSADPNALENLHFHVYVDSPAGTTTPGTVTISGDLAPTSSSDKAATGPVPRFAGASSANPLVSVTACQPQSGPPPPPPPPQSGPPPGTAAPVIQSASASPKTFAVDSRGPSEVAVNASAPKRASKGTTLRYSLSEASRVVFTIERSLPGRTSGKNCLKPTHKNRKKRNCTRYILTGRFAVQSSTGANDHHFSGRIGTNRLKPGNYRVTLVATDAANKHSTPERFSIKVVSR